MSLPVVVSPDRLAGAVLAVVGAMAFASARRYGFGSMSSIGPGAFPAIASAIVFLCGVFLMVAPPKDSPRRLPFALRPMLAILGSIAAWAIVAPRFGLVPGTFALVLISAVAMERPHWKAALLTAAALSVIGALVFTRFLGVPLPVLSWR